jgi:alpha-tubulin suppressor-like RCC1 family protein
MACICLLGGCAEQSIAATPMIAGGGEHAWMLKKDGTVVAMGADSFGQLGQGRNVVVSSPAQALGLGGVSSISVTTHALALKSDGTVWVWGKNDAGQLGDGSQTASDVPIRMPGMSGIVAVAAGMNHSLLLKSDGTVWGVGKNSEGQLGAEGGGNELAPVRAGTLTGIVAIAAGFDTSVVVRNDGTVWTWGNNTDGQLGRTTTYQCHSGPCGATPGQVPGLSGVTAVATGINHVLALKSDGTVWAWGANSSGKLGDGTTTSRNSPVRVTGLDNVKAIAAGWGHSVALKNDGTVWTWGNNAFGALGIGVSATIIATTPVQVTGLTEISQIAASYGNTAAIRADGGVWAWGANSGQFGDGSALYLASPVQLTALADIRSICIGFVTSAVRNDGTVWSWGWNGYGTVGAGGLGGSTLPVAVAGLSQVRAVATGWGSGLALKEDGTVWQSGMNIMANFFGGGDLGTSTASQVAALSGIAHIASGDSHNLALKNDGTVWSWGWNGYGQLGDGSQTDHATPAQVPDLGNVVAIAAGWYQSLALKSDGTVWGWGNNDSGQLGETTQTQCSTGLGGSPACNTLPAQIAGLNNAIALATGQNHSLALKNDGTVWAWGDGNSGQLGNGGNTSSATPAQVPGLSGITAIAAAYEYSLALKSDGTVWAWGNNYSGQLGDGTSNTTRFTPLQVLGLSDAIAIAAGDVAAYALKSDGTVWAWGWNDAGQFGDGTYIARTTPTLATNETADGPLDLIPETANAIPADKLPAFYLAAAKSGGLSATNLSATLKGGTATRSSLRSTGNYKVFVAALAAGQLSGWFQLDANRSWSALSWPMAEFMTGVDLGSQTTQLVVDILDDANLVSLGGTTFYLGYGTSADEMLAAGRYRDIYKVPAQ